MKFKPSYKWRKWFAFWRVYLKEGRQDGGKFAWFETVWYQRSFATGEIVYMSDRDRKREQRIARSSEG